MATSLAGSRIREARLRSGKTQARLAKEAGISASYLNLIEHNRRKIAGATLRNLAQALNLPAGDLTDGGDSALLSDLRAAAAEHPEAGVDPESAGLLVSRFPDWAQLIAAQARHMRQQSGVIGALSDRLGHDPLLAENVHAMLSRITAIRSTAGILASVDTIPALQQKRFHETLAQESDHLSDTAQTLARTLTQTVTEATGPAAGTGTAADALDRFLRRHAYSFDALDREVQDKRSASFIASRQREIIDEMLTGEDLTANARQRIHGYLSQYAHDAVSLPLHPFAQAARDCDFDPARLAHTFDADLATVFRRLAVLRRPWIEAPLFGLLVVSASGQPLLRHPLPDFALPRHGAACALWPAFHAFARPGQPLLDHIEHDNGKVFTAYSVALPRHDTAFGTAPDFAAHMLIRPFEGESPPPARPVGTSCRICTRADCASRSDASLLS